MRIPSPVPPVPTAVAAPGSHALRRGAAIVLGVTVTVLCLAVGTGWLDAMRGWRLLGAGPLVHDALPLRQLAGAGAQPLLRVVVAWLLTGAMGAYLLRAWRPRARPLVLGVGMFAAYVLASDAQYALAHNLRVLNVIDTRSPTAAAFVAAACVAAGAAAPRMSKR